jgi:hypothetical protein
MFEITDPGRDLLRAIVSAPLGWQTPVEISALLGLDLDRTSEALADLDAGGWLASWETERALYVTLTPHAAERLRVRLVQVGRSEVMRWRSLDEPEPPAPHVSTVSSGRADFLDLIADPAPGPEAEAIGAEHAQRLAATKAAEGGEAWLALLPRPTILLGLGLTPWPGPRPAAGRPCPGCNARELSMRSYCLVCDRWGLDHLLVAARGRAFRPAGPRRSTPNEPRDVAGQATAAKASRKARRRRKWVAMAQSAKARKPAGPLAPRRPSA